MAAQIVKEWSNDVALKVLSTAGDEFLRPGESEVGDQMVRSGFLKPEYKECRTLLRLTDKGQACLARLRDQVIANLPQALLKRALLIVDADWFGQRVQVTSSEEMDDIVAFYQARHEEVKIQDAFEVENFEGAELETILEPMLWFPEHYRPGDLMGQGVCRKCKKSQWVHIRCLPEYRGERFKCHACEMASYEQY